MPEKVLVVDDSLTVRHGLRLLLERLGHQVKLARDGNEAVRVLLDESFDLVLLDIVMPGDDGLATLRRVRESHPVLPVVLMSGLSHEGVAERLESGEAQEFLMKPFGAAELAGVIARFVRRSG